MIDALTAEEIAERLSGSPEGRTAFIRSAAEAGVAEAQAIYGQMLLDGVEVALDQQAALDWFLKAAAQHHAMAINMVGRCYDLGWGTPVMKDRAAACFRIAAEMGLDWGMYNYATALALGEGVDEDKAAAFGWLEKAAAMGNAKAVNFVGSFHEDGWVVARDMAKAAECYARAAEGGDFRGCFNHARMLGIAGEVDEALVWLARAGETATAAFLDKAEAWLRRSDVPGFAEHGPLMLRRGKAAC
ncbi:tetratricopeptide repeat protein [Hephaestia sp. GCM10023244]|uniref:tetratricopeptide repeat protein n=1 Tax=unclassified Hephaestia TaxID=2631281 RepID=UPI00207770B8|nr:tetratricopeptide repeat protein [Hephaestia sp. MAHUQ-44]MCM8729922.1 sel1 repeat family protein [Hephaestia sp. MAHUQ-44]